MRNYNLKLKNFEKNFENTKDYILNEKKTTKIGSKIYQERKNSHSPGSFGYKRTGK
jgi:hypothetical protein